MTVTGPGLLTATCSVYEPGYTNMTCELVSAGRDTKADVRLEKEFSIAPLTEKITAPAGGTVPLVG